MTTCTKLEVSRLIASIASAELATPESANHAIMVNKTLTPYGQACIVVTMVETANSREEAIEYVARTITNEIATAYERGKAEERERVREWMVKKSGKGIYSAHDMKQEVINYLTK